MKILHIIEDFSLKSGGLRTVVKNLDFYLNSTGEESFIISSDKEDKDIISIVKSNNPWMYTKKWSHQIIKTIEINKIDVVHIHGVWMYPQYIAAKICTNNNIPFILTPHGMYEPWLWKKSTFKKNFVFKFLTKIFFSNAKYIHGITTDEILNLKSLFTTNNFIEIPNLISINHERNYTTNLKPKYVLYLGRLDSKKGIEILLKVFSKIKDPSLILKIAGGFNQYKGVLEKLIKSLNITNKVLFLGMIKGEQKQDIIRNAWVMVAPSFSEVIGMVNLEAAALKTPVITTYQTGIKKEWNNNGGILINPNIDELYTALNKVILWSDKERKRNGEKLFKFVEKEYSWEKNLINWKELYKETIKV